MKKIIPALTLLLLTSSAALAQFTPSTENLRGVTGIHLMVMLGHYGHRMDEAQKPEILKLVEADAAAKLEKAGIPFYRSPSDPRKNINAVLVITVTMTETEAAGRKRIDNEVKLLQTVRLSRDPSIEFEAVTWLTEGSVTGPAQFVMTGTRDQVGDLIDGFIKDYFSVNPKRSARSNQPRVSNARKR